MGQPGDRKLREPKLARPRCRCRSRITPIRVGSGARRSRRWRRRSSEHVAQSRPSKSRFRKGGGSFGSWSYLIGSLRVMRLPARELLAKSSCPICTLTSKITPLGRTMSGVLCGLSDRRPSSRAEPAQSTVGRGRSPGREIPPLPARGSGARRSGVWGPGSRVRGRRPFCPCGGRTTRSSSGQDGCLRAADAGSNPVRVAWVGVAHPNPSCGWQPTVDMRNAKESRLAFCSSEARRDPVRTIRCSAVEERVAFAHRRRRFDSCLRSDYLGSGCGAPTRAMPCLREIPRFPLFYR